MRPEGVKEPVDAEGRKRRLLAALFASGFTVFDAFISWLVIDKMGVAEEMNGLLVRLAEATNFAIAMLIRALVGLVLVWALWAISLLPGREGRFAARGMYFVTGLLSLLALYHITGIMLTL